MRTLLPKLVVAAVLAASVTGCGYSRVGHRHRGNGTLDMIAAGIVVGAAIVELAASSSRASESSSVPSAPAYYAYGPPPAPLPRSPRDLATDAAPAPFDPHAARSALNAVDLSSCRGMGAPRGYGHARVTLNPDGQVSKVVIDAPSGMPDAAARCVGDRLGAVTMPSFKGSLVTMGTTFHLD
ncbi:MAG: hypothetical protein KF764_10030 [Labilithrix sp.]|nr:hypothetical protein [Labilithrix sp.]MBX3219839.1 hypothetical protein [Labilithrix sp.]